MFISISWQTAPHSEEEVSIQETSEQTITLEGQDISPEKLTPEQSEVIAIETTREDLDKVEKEKTTFEFVTPEKTELSSLEVTVDESPLPDEDKVAPTATATEVSLATTLETEEVIPKPEAPEDVTGIETDSKLLVPEEQLLEQREAPQEEVSGVLSSIRCAIVVLSWGFN